MLENCVSFWVISFLGYGATKWASRSSNGIVHVQCTQKTGVWWRISLDGTVHQVTPQICRKWMNFRTWSYRVIRKCHASFGKGRKPVKLQPSFSYKHFLEGRVCFSLQHISREIWQGTSLFYKATLWPFIICHLFMSCHFIFIVLYINVYQ